MKINWLLVLIYITILTFLALGLTYYFLLIARGMTVTSWWRTPQHNAKVGGVRNSLHLIGLAWDAVPVTQENENYMQSLGLKVINEGDHLHGQIV